MAELLLPKKSRVNNVGKVHTCEASNKKTFKIYRYDPEKDENPRLDTFEINMDECGPMVLDALIKIKNDLYVNSIGILASYFLLYIYAYMGADESYQTLQCKNLVLLTNTVFI